MSIKEMKKIQERKGMVTQTAVVMKERRAFMKKAFLVIYHAGPIMCTQQHCSTNGHILKTIPNIRFSYFELAWKMHEF